MSRKTLCPFCGSDNADFEDEDSDIVEATE